MESRYRREFAITLRLLPVCSVTYLPGLSKDLLEYGPDAVPIGRNLIHLLL